MCDFLLVALLVFAASLNSSVFAAVLNGSVWSPCLLAGLSPSQSRLLSLSTLQQQLASQSLQRSRLLETPRTPGATSNSRSGSASSSTTALSASASGSRGVLPAGLEAFDRLSITPKWRDAASASPAKVNCRDLSLSFSSVESSHVSALFAQRRTCHVLCSFLTALSVVCLPSQAAKPHAVASLTRAFASKLSTRKWEEKELPANVAKTPERDANGANASSPAAQRGHLPCLRCLSQPVAHSNSRSLLRVLDSLFLPPGQRTR